MQLRRWVRPGRNTRFVSNPFFRHEVHSIIDGSFFASMGVNRWIRTELTTVRFVSSLNHKGNGVQVGGGGRDKTGGIARAFVVYRIDTPQQGLLALFNNDNSPNASFLPAQFGWGLPRLQQLTFSKCALSLSPGRSSNDPIAYPIMKYMLHVV